MNVIFLVLEVTFMAVGALVAGGVLAAGGIASAVAASRMKTKPKGVNYGGSADATNGYRKSFAENADGAAGTLAVGQNGLAGTAGSAGARAAQGDRLIDTAGNRPGFQVGNASTNILTDYSSQVGKGSALAGQAALENLTQANLGGARSGGALGLRNALNANAMAGIRVAQDQAAQTAAEEQAYLGAKVNNAQTIDAAKQQAFNQQEAARLAQINAGAGLATTSQGQAIGANTALTSSALTNQGQQIQALQTVEEQQLKADMDYERRRQEEAQRKSNNWFNFGGALVGAGGQVAASGGGG